MKKLNTISKIVAEASQVAYLVSFNASAAQTLTKI